MFIIEWLNTDQGKWVKASESLTPESARDALKTEMMAWPCLDWRVRDGQKIIEERMVP